MMSNVEYTQLDDELFGEKEVSVSVLRLDKIHPYISGNKWFKLKYNIEEFFQIGKKFLVTFGGAYSNHIAATAAAGKEAGIKTVGIIRGDELNENSNPLLEFAAGCGMKMIFISREAYRQKDDRDFVLQLLRGKSGPEAFTGYTDEWRVESDPDLIYILPEGGSNKLAVKGCAEILGYIPAGFDFVCCACGTGATLAGISTALNENQEAIGIAVLQGKNFLEENILGMNGHRSNFRIIHDYHFGGYAKSNPDLDLFCERFSSRHRFEIEPVYTGKLFYGLTGLIKKDYFPKGARVVVVHTGGLFEGH